MTKVLVNGREGCGIDPADRGLHYGDGLFETMAVRDGRPRLFDWHLERLAAGARRLRIPLPEATLLREEIGAIAGPGQAVVKLIVTRGISGRGYRPASQAAPTRIVAAYSWPDRPAAAWAEGVRAGWCHTRLGRNAALAGLKHLNRLEQVLARAEWDDEGLEEGLMLDDRDHVISGTQTNLFARIGGRWITPVLDQCGVAGVARRAFGAWAKEHGAPVIESELSMEALASATSLALTNALIGAWPVRELAGRPYSPDPDVAKFNAWLAAR